MDNVISEFFNNITVPLPYPKADSSSTDISESQSLAIAGVALVFILIFCLNLVLLVFILKLQGSHVTGFNLLVANQLLVNMLSVSLIDPWEIIAGPVLNQWPYSEMFCRLSRFFSICLPFLACWNITLITLHQLLAYVCMERSRFHGSFFHTISASKLIIILPPVIIWVTALTVHSPITYHAWGLSLEIVHVNPNKVLCVYNLPFLYQGVSLFISPAFYGLAFVTVLFLTRLCTKREFPQPYQVEPQANGSSTVVFRQIPTVHIQHVDPANNPQHSNINPAGQILYTSVPTTAVEGTASGNAETRAREISTETVAIAGVLLIGLTVFVGPYGILALCVSIWPDSVEDIWIMVLFIWMMAKQLYESIAVFYVMFRHNRFKNCCRSRCSRSLPT